MPRDCHFAWPPRKLLLWSHSTQAVVPSLVSLKNEGPCRCHGARRSSRTAPNDPILPEWKTIVHVLLTTPCAAATAAILPKQSPSTLPRAASATCKKNTLIKSPSCNTMKRWDKCKITANIPDRCNPRCKELRIIKQYQENHQFIVRQIRFILLQNRQGKTRLAKYYVPLEDSEKHKVEYEVHRLVVNRDPKFTNFVEFRTHKVIYRRYAGLFFSMCVDITDNELAYLECIHLFVEILDHFFSNVCELDLVFNFHKVYLILDEFILAGELQETSKRVGL
ncbi:hypothetical protein PR202_gb00263 [Eleusine coracana subsp. coracana]|uniref:AP-2 complex subunit sigma n=1 Tax=Eleusine coracana subsp. coracana TaxID=191504 RepID=A0AAV5DSQ4_ELECO|nr:hypothetical protein PR202_gb00263 [Eleusine coracana subsp. coracana]